MTDKMNYDVLIILILLLTSFGFGYMFGKSKKK